VLVMRVCTVVGNVNAKVKMAATVFIIKVKHMNAFPH